MSAAIDDNDDAIASINMVPFIDISLVLLIIFMVTSSVIARSAIEVDLPSAVSGETVAPSTIGIVVGANGVLACNGTATTLEELRLIVATEVAADEHVQAIIAGDQTVAYARIMEVIDVVRLGGVGSFALNIDPSTEGRTL